MHLKRTRDDGKIIEEEVLVSSTEVEPKLSGKMESLDEHRVDFVLRGWRNLKKLVLGGADLLVDAFGLNVHGAAPSNAVRYDTRTLGIVLGGVAVFDGVVWLHTLLDLLVHRRDDYPFTFAFCVFTAILFAVVSGIVNRSLFAIPSYDDASAKWWTRTWFKMRLGGRGGLLLGVTALTTLMASLRIFAPQIQQRAGEEAILAEMAQAQWQNDRIVEAKTSATNTSNGAKAELDKSRQRLTEIRNQTLRLEEGLGKKKTEQQITEAAVNKARVTAVSFQRAAAAEKDEEARRPLVRRAQEATLRARTLDDQLDRLEEEIQRDDIAVKQLRDEQQRLTGDTERAREEAATATTAADRHKTELEQKQDEMRRRYEAIRTGRCDGADTRFCGMKLTLFEQGRLLVDLSLAREPRWPPFVAEQQRTAALRAHGLLAEGEELARYRSDDASIFRGFSIVALLIALFLPIMVVFYKAFLRTETQKYLAGPLEGIAPKLEAAPELPTVEDLTAIPVLGSSDAAEK